MSEASEKQGKVVAVTDRRTSSGGKDEATAVEQSPPAQAAPEVPPAPKDRNEQVKPCTVNRNALDPFGLIEVGKGTARDRDKATLTLRAKLTKMHRAADVSFYQLSDLVRQLDERDVVLRDWMARPWYRRWFRRLPPFPPLEVPEMVNEAPAAPPVNREGSAPAAEAETTEA